MSCHVLAVFVVLFNYTVEAPLPFSSITIFGDLSCNTYLESSVCLSQPNPGGAAAAPCLATLTTVCMRHGPGSQALTAIRALKLGASGRLPVRPLFDRLLQRGNVSEWNSTRVGKEKERWRVFLDGGCKPRPRPPGSAPHPSQAHASCIRSGHLLSAPERISPERKPRRREATSLFYPPYRLFRPCSSNVPQGPHVSGHGQCWARQSDTKHWRNATNRVSGQRPKFQVVVVCCFLCSPGRCLP